MARKKVKRWEDHRITGIGRREARTAFYRDSQKKISLNGEWDFKYVDAPELSPEGFEQSVYESNIILELLWELIFRCELSH